MSKRAFTIFLFIAGAAFGYYLWNEPIAIPGLPEFSKDAVTQAINEIEHTILAPPGLRASKEAADAFLTRSGVISETNKKRAAEGLAPLTQNLKLNVAALAKVEDMFALQYFAHESPNGKGAGDLADDAGYRYIVIGENLALGNFANDTDLVQAWMDSPGHRANILHARFQEIGVAVKKGMYEGKSTWLAVQEFGTPITACPEPDTSLKGRIDANEAELKLMQAELDEKRKEIEAENSSKKQDYREKIEAYNAMIYAYNELVKETKTLVDQYNAQVRQTNTCIAG